MKKLISLILPTRGMYRFGLLNEFINSAIDLANDKRDIEIVLKLDDDDVETISACQNQLRTDVDIEYFISPRLLGYPSLNKHFSDAMRISSGEWICMVSDDNIFKTKNWDSILKSHYEKGFDSHIFWANHLLGHTIGIINPIFSRNVMNWQLNMPQSNGLISTHPLADLYWEKVLKSPGVGAIKQWNTNNEIILIHERRIGHSYQFDYIGEQCMPDMRPFNETDYIAISEVARLILEYRTNNRQGE